MELLMNKEVVGSVSQITRAVAQVCSTTALVLFFVLFFGLSLIWPHCANLGREVTSQIIFEFVCFWFYLLALDVKLILLIIDDLLVKDEKNACSRAG